MNAEANVSTDNIFKKEIIDAKSLNQGINISIYASDDNYEYNHTIEIDVNRSILNTLFKSLSEKEM